MKRLFISLYLLVSLSFLGIGWTLDSIWQKSVEDSGAMDAPLVALAQLLEKIPQQEREKYLGQLNHNPDYPLKLVDASQIALSPESELTSDKLLIASQGDDHELHFIKVGQQVLIAGPIEIDPRARLRGLFTLFFYLSLAFVSLIWVWPLSRDLKTLKSATQEFGQAKWDTQIELSKRSQVLPLAVTFNEMSQQIRTLIENHKHLSNAVSHEIRTPLARLKFALALMPQYCRPDSDPKRRDEFIDEMQQDVKEMEKLLQELLTYASLESKQNNVQFEHCDLEAIAKHTIEKLSSSISAPITFKQSVNPVYISGDPMLIERAIQNLITNAQRFGRQSIEVAVKQNQQDISLSITDDGQGIPMEDQSKIFEPFYRSQSVQNGNKGHGLGLAIIRRIMDRHKGKVTLESRDGFTCFTLHWPVITSSKTN
ncbi:ATP-binding protein [Shewanella violacea]|uniref:histidine kinase n=1 Tax=Shewanella violacea (strain JCM 10179 / CIP 106290 / LMG 19151 / DSS12) TaxID=637905 RepID=D4ZGH9_SHEVD|nr:ATP-binding protein [Shewanella violacea]BAJ00778.1 sensor protein RstB, putative [Shewanella violacea DSS12]